ncbi:MAG: EAL domain-containing protein [Pseudomonas sp.]|uniref:putative bifunctional diguanylate cyclase/phosphodiesterase n=1 Tax=Pseudomonas sp. TaxID=306 RepID=UPI003BB6FE35
MSQRLWRFCLFCLLTISTAQQLAAAPLAVAYSCQGEVSLAGLLASDPHWLPAEDGRVPVERLQDQCWIRINQLPKATEPPEIRWLSFANLHVQRVDLLLLDAEGRTIGRAQRMGANSNALVSGQRALFIPPAELHLPLYAHLSLAAGIRPLPGLSHVLQAEWVEPSASLYQEQRTDLRNISVSVLLAASAVMVGFFGLALRNASHLIYALYASAQALTVFAKTGLPFAVGGASVWLLDAWSFQCLVAMLAALLCARFGHFRRHSPRTCYLAYAIGGAFLLLIPLARLAPDWAAQASFMLLPLHFATLLSGNWRGWRRGERSCGILLVGMLPISLYWLIFLTYNLIFKQPMPSALALGSNFDILRTLALPAAFCYGLAERTLRLQQETERLARFDPLTKLNNREGIRQHGQNLIEQGGQPSAVMLNIERFKAINETLGVALGDQILIETGRRLSRLAAQYPEARAGRMHADQFCLLYPHSDDLEQLRAQINQRFNCPAEVAGQTVDIALAGGIARPAEDTLDMAQLLRNAEVALDVARSQHKSWVEYQPELESSQRADLALLSELKRAVEQNELRVYLQPKVRLHDGAITCAEALVRWHHPKRGTIAPGNFVPFAEKTGRITLLTHWMLAEAMCLSVLWRRQGRPLQISVNLSAFDLAEKSFVSGLLQMLKNSGADPADIRLEITESAAMQDPTEALAVMNALYQAGFSLSIDDFGTGYSSLAYLQKMPAEELKIDRSFIHNVQPNSEAAVLLESTIDLGHRLGLSLVGEGAETAEEWALLCALGCDYAQGWFAAKPMQIADFELWRLANNPFSANLPEHLAPINVERWRTTEP